MSREFMQDMEDSVTTAATAPVIVGGLSMAS